MGTLIYSSNVHFVSIKVILVITKKQKNCLKICARICACVCVCVCAHYFVYEWEGKREWRTWFDRRCIKMSVTCSSKTNRPLHGLSIKTGQAFVRPPLGVMTPSRNCQSHWFGGRYACLQIYSNTQWVFRQIFWHTLRVFYLYCPRSNIYKLPVFSGNHHICKSGFLFLILSLLFTWLCELVL